jgi:hypothetical protein
MIEAKFFEEFPLYRVLKYPDIGDTPQASLHRIASPMQAECAKCGCERTFSPFSARPASLPNTRVDMGVAGHIFTFDYRCGACGCSRYYFVAFHKDAIHKVGQHPPWSIEPPTQVKKAIDKYLGLYKKGLANESISYGVGAYSYYRRIVENVIDELLTSIGSLIPDSDKVKYEAALEKAKEERAADKKIELVKELLPASLRAGGMNPLELLYGALSEGLHSASDEECLSLAEAVRTGLTILVEEIQQAKDRQEKLTDSMRKLLDRKSRRGKSV